MKKTFSSVAALSILGLLFVGAGCSKSAAKPSAQNAGTPNAQQQPTVTTRTSEPPTPPPNIPPPTPVSPTGTK